MTALKKPIPVDRIARPIPGALAWLCEAKTHPFSFTGATTAENKQRSREAIERAIVEDGYDPRLCDIQWMMLDSCWGWGAKVRET